MSSPRNEKWKELSSKRMSRILQLTEQIAHLSSLNYEYEDEWLRYLLDSYFKKGEEIQSVFEEFDTDTIKKLPSTFSFSNVSDLNELTRKQQKFIEIGQKRMTKLYKEMNYFGRLANKKNYNYDQMDVDYLFEVYENKGVELRKWFPPYHDERVPDDVQISNYPSEG
jgi:hypothetical protein